MQAGSTVQYLKKILEKQDFANLEKECLLALKDFPENFEIQEIYASALASNKSFDKAIKIYQFLIENNPNSYHPYFCLAKIFSIKGEVKDAEDHYIKAISLKNNDHNLHKTYSIFLKEIKNYEKCEKILLEAKKKFPKNLDFDLLLSSIYFDQEKFEQSLIILLDIRKKIKNKNIDYQISKILIRLERLEDAEGFLVGIIKEDSNFLSGYLSLFYIYNLQGNFEKLQVKLRDAYKIFPKDASLFAYRVDHLVKEIGNEEVLYFENNLKKESLENQIIINFALSKFYEKNKSNLKFVHFLKEANSLKRSNYKNYNFDKHILDLKSLLSSNIDILFNQFKNQPSLNGSSENIFIVGMPRSGSTLIEQILSSHSKIKGIGESSLFPNSIEKFFPKMSLKDFFNEIKKSKNGEIFKSLSDEYSSQLKKIKNNKSYILDKNLFNFLFIPIIKLCFPKAKFIYCSRDKFDNCFSIFKINFGDKYLPWTYNEIEISKFYDVHLQIMNFYKSFLGNDIYEVNYKSIVNNFIPETRKILSFLNLNYEEACEEFYKNKNLVYTASQTQVRKKIYDTSINYSKEFENYFKDLL